MSKSWKATDLSQGPIVINFVERDNQTLVRIHQYYNYLDEKGEEIVNLGQKSMVEEKKIDNYSKKMKGVINHIKAVMKDKAMKKEGLK